MRLPEPLSSYDVLEQIGSGGEAVVYRARDRSGREWALKIYHQEGAADQRVWNRLRLLTHRALMQIEHTGHLEDGRDYEVMPYFPGHSLHGQGPMPQGELLAVVCELIGGINQLHIADIVHRDLKPSNILYDRAVRAVKIADFGISRAPRQQTRVACTVGYAPPEAYDQLITPAWDWWSLGTIVYELATGAVLFAGRSSAQIEALVRKGEVTHLDKLPPRWRTLCTGLLVADPERRWGSGEALAWLHGEDVPVVGAAGTTLPVTVRDPVPVKPAAGPQQPKAGPAEQPEAKGFEYDGEYYRSAQGLAAALTKRPKRAAEIFFGPPGAGADHDAQLRALGTWAGKNGKKLPPHIISGSQEPIVRLNHLLYWLDPMSPPVLDAGPLRPATLVRLCVLAGEAVATPSDRRAMAVIRSGDLLAHWGHCPGFEGLKKVHRAWRSGLAEWERAVADQGPHVQRLLEPARPVVDALMLLALLPYPGAEGALWRRAHAQSAPAGTVVDWYDALVQRFGGSGTPMGMVVRAVCGPAALTAAHESVVAKQKAKKAAATKPKSNTQPKAQPEEQQPKAPPKAQPKAQAQPASSSVLDFHGQHRKGAALAQALRTHKAEAMSVFLEASGAPRAGELAAWLRTLKETPTGRVDSLDTLLQQRLAGGASTDVKLLYLLRWLQPGGAAPYGGRDITMQRVVDACVTVLGKPPGTSAHTFVRTLAAPHALDALGGFSALAELGPAGKRLVEFQRTVWRSLGRHGVAPAERIDRILAAGLLLGLGSDLARKRLIEAAETAVAKQGPQSAWFEPVLVELGGHGSRQGAAVEAALLPLARQHAIAEATAANAAKKAKKAQAAKTAKAAKTAQTSKTAQAAKTTKTAKNATQPKPTQPKPSQPKPPQAKAKKAQPAGSPQQKAKKTPAKKAQTAGNAQKKPQNNVVQQAQTASGSKLTERIRAWLSSRGL
ncbi:outer membrane biosynthesis protein TonB [Streptomyces griseochromogenes]|uniref:Outer membrane biosynthesis protein TonB n=1 Tax=Streptomyces griseochromogenes TaxID=68214 RepID=A0A1B1AQM4_9ACTN|nr:serine/threonine-protein kinase [Streptomyces griseochromogenes]ANP48864.1 hypothetical protein AVL59_04110 [Streptomyces griseochromogenes]MBP2049649.1 outer membrane biosynthesis protein TonB [Streptomyces griseochromogenes]